MTSTHPPLEPVAFRGNAPAGLRPGDVLRDAAVVATSADPRVATENFTTGSLLAVSGHGGRYVGPLSQFPAEEEVAFGPGVRLRVVATGEVDGLDVVVTVVDDAGPSPDVTALTRQVIAQVRAARDRPAVTLPRTGRFTTPWAT